MSWESITPEDAVELLNDALICDRDAISRLVQKRISCTHGLADHPTIQCRETQARRFSVGVLGIINGLFGVDSRGYAPITAVYDDDGGLVEFRLTAQSE
jgi:hypothetical protein